MGVKLIFFPSQVRNSVGVKTIDSFKKETGNTSYWDGRVAMHFPYVGGGGEVEAEDLRGQRVEHH